MFRCPVFDTKGNVIAIVSQVYYQRGINVKEERLLNQAFSIEPLKQKIDHITTNIIE